MSSGKDTRRASKFDGERRGERWTKTANTAKTENTAFKHKFNRFKRWVHKCG